MTSLAHVQKDWVYLHNRQCLAVTYCEGSIPGSPVVPEGHREIYRNFPPEKPLLLKFNRQMSYHQRDELTNHITKYHNAHPLNSPYRRAHLTRVEQGWRPGGGDTDEVRDHVKFTSHSSKWYREKNMIGEPHIIRRPLTVSFGDEVEPDSRSQIEQKVREQHASMADIANSNVAIVVGGSYKNTQGKDEAQVGYYEFPDCPQSQVEQYKDHGLYPVALE